MRRAGFTLIELLMVISIIAVLAALLIPLIGYARTMAKNAKCEAQLGTIKTSMALYKDANGFTPEKYVATNPNDFTPPITPPIKAGDEVFAKVFTTGVGTSIVYRTAATLTSDEWTNVAEALLKQLQTVDRDNYRDINALRDPFTGGGVSSNVFRFRPAKFYPLQPAGILIDSENPPNPDTYQLWSAGADGKDQFGERVNNRKSDDITNWKTP